VQQKVENGVIFVKASKEESASIKSWRMMKFDRERNWWYGEISMPLLKKLERLGGLVAPAREELERAERVRQAVDKERMKPDADVVPLADYPVKAKLFTHQMRAANMALILFGIIDPEKVTP